MGWKAAYPFSVSVPLPVPVPVPVLADCCIVLESRRKDHSEIKSFAYIFANIAEYADDKSDYLKERQDAPDH